MTLMPVPGTVRPVWLHNPFDYASEILASPAPKTMTPAEMALTLAEGGVVWCAVCDDHVVGMLGAPDRLALGCPCHRDAVTEQLARLGTSPEQLGARWAGLPTVAEVLRTGDQNGTVTA